MIIRRPVPEEAEQISECIRESTTDSEMADGSREGIEDWIALSSADEIRDRISGSEVNLIAVEEDKIIGYISFKRTNHMSLLFVRDGHKRKGIGRRLFQEAAKGFTEITLNSSDYAVPFYAAMGFRPTGVRFHKNGAWSTPMKIIRGAQQGAQPDASGAG